VAVTASVTERVSGGGERVEARVAGDYGRKGKLTGGSHLSAAPGEGEGAHAGAAGGGGLGRGLRPCRMGCASRGKERGSWAVLAGWWAVHMGFGPRGLRE
jgi:hypothetical protein